MLKFIKQDWLELQPSGIFGYTEQNRIHVRTFLMWYIRC